jgi:hypothetical protein
MKTLSLFLAALFISFSSFKSSDDTKLLTGKYGVCPNDNESQIVFTLNDDHTFVYTNKSISAVPVTAKGKWKQDGENIILTEITGGNVTEKWTIDDNGKCLKSRSGMEWTRICHLESCK